MFLLVVTFFLVLIATDYLLDKAGVDNVDDFNNMKTYSICAILVGFLWMYFFHVAFYITTIAHAVSHWFFSTTAQNRARCNFGGVPVVSSAIEVLLYHMGSLAMG